MKGGRRRVDSLADAWTWREGARAVGRSLSRSLFDGLGARAQYARCVSERVRACVFLYEHCASVGSSQLTQECCSCAGYMNIDWNVSRVCATAATAAALSGCVVLATRRRIGIAHKRIIAGKSALNNYVAIVRAAWCWVSSIQAVVSSVLTTNAVWICMADRCV